MEVSESELTIIENALVKTREALGEDESPEAMAIKEQILEAEQIVSGKIDRETNPDNLSGPTGGAVGEMPPGMAPTPEPQGEISMEQMQALAMHLQEALAVIQKMMPT